MPGVPGSKAGLDPGLQPLTTVVVEGGTALEPAELERLRDVLSRLDEFRKAGPPADRR